MADGLDTTFTNASSVESVCWQMRLSDWPRAVNRARINDLGNGVPPYTAEEAVQNNVTHNFNSLESTTIFHNARRQFYTGLEAPDPLFTVNIDYGPIYRRNQWGSAITKCMSKIIKESVRYKECQRNVFALDVLHGIGPSTWVDRERWCPKALGVEDVLIPSGTQLDMDNLPFFAMYKQWTGNQLWKMTHGPKVDPGWNIPLVERAIEWIDEQAHRLMGSTWPEVWSPEKWSERIKEDSGLYSSDKIPTIDCYEFYYWSDEKKNTGWRRRIVLDAWGTPGMGGVGGIPYAKPTNVRNYEFGSNEFLYDSGTRKYADKLSEIIHFQFADGSCVAPFRYHAVRSLGFLMYSVCQIQNRIRCKFTEAAVESMMQYLRTSNPDEAERALAINLIDKRVIPAGVEFIPREQRWQVDAALVESVLQMGRQTMSDNSASFTQDFDFSAEQNREETATRTIAKVNSTAALVGAMLQQAYDYQKFQYMEICRRFTMKNSKDPDVRKFRVNVLKEGVPEEVLNNSECWDIQPQRVVGSGNKQVQSMMMNQAMQVYDKLNPEAQQKVLRMWLAVNLDDYQLADELVPETQHISESVHDAQQSVGTIMEGTVVSPKPGLNITETIETWLHSMATIMAPIEQSGGMTTPDKLQGLQNFGNHIAQRIQILAQDPTMKQKVKVYSDDLSQLMNMVKAYAQRLQEQMQANQPNGDGKMQETQAKIAAMTAESQNKIQLAQQSHAAKTAQRQITFEQKVKQDAVKQRQELATQAVQHRQQLAATDLETAATIHREKVKADNEPSTGKTTE